jgi:hypothetical protein|tara:strand:- start:96 stop:260 length:165 start_codon:yes stop_codon:yes gene_type:complete
MSNAWHEKTNEKNWQEKEEKIKIINVLRQIFKKTQKNRRTAARTFLPMWWVRHP